ncbi:MAG: hypothetical protein LBC29_05405, partial [Propionibacteriaceae bacterium]|nr:hypothetical protein [Propionibacteriaceae bacterium]
HTGLPWFAIPAATYTPFRMTRALLFGSGGQTIRRIRHLDARSLLYASVDTLLRNGTSFVDTYQCITRLSQLAVTPTVNDLITKAGIEERWAIGLLEGWLTKCPRHITWRILGYIELQEATALNQPHPNPETQPDKRKQRR